MSAFNLHKGGTLESIEHLRDALPGMSSEVFSHHVNGGINDFATWIMDVFGDPELSFDVRGSSSKDDMHQALTQNTHEAETLRFASKKLDEASRLLQELANQ